MEPTEIYRKQRRLDKLERLKEERELSSLEERRYRLLSNQNELITSEELRDYHRFLIGQCRRILKQRRGKLEAVIETYKERLSEFEENHDSYNIFCILEDKILDRIRWRNGEEVSEKIRPILDEIKHLIEYGHIE